MIEIRGRIVGNTIVLETPADLPEGQEVRVQIEAVPDKPKKREPRKAGALEGKIIMSDDFNDTPEGFEEYMP